MVTVLLALLLAPVCAVVDPTERVGEALSDVSDDDRLRDLPDG